jgi:choline dehydrogenase-like flavoprotein
MKTYRTADEVDFLIVGTGAAGGVLAWELSRRGHSVVALEQGPFIHPSDFVHDEVDNLFERRLMNKHDRQPNTFRKTEQEVAVPRPAVEYGCMVGGGTAHFTANYWRFHEIDFVEASKKGPIAGTGFADWPITYADLEPYYTKVEWEIGVSGDAGANPFDPPRSRPYPTPALPIKSSGALFERGAKKLGWHPAPAPLAILSQAYDNRPGCVHCGFCEFFGCEVGAKSSTLATVIPKAIATGRCEVRADSYVSAIETDANGRATGATYFDAKGAVHHQRARAVILSCNGAETPRLLLLSASRLWPDGLANSSGLVGRYLMFNTSTFTGGLFERSLNEYKSVQVTRIVHDFYEIDPKHGFYGGGGLDGRFDFYPMSFAFSALPPEIPKWGPQFKAALAEYFTHSMFVLTHGVSLPVAANSISLDPTVKDAWGLPAMRVTYKEHPDDVKSMQFFQDRGVEVLEAAGAKKVWRFPFEEQIGSPHLLGTCRMGHDPKTSVVDADHRAHDVKNLFICDGSSFVTSGRGQPTCTIQALAFRAGDRIATLAGRGEI